MKKGKQKYRPKYKQKEPVSQSQQQTQQQTIKQKAAVKPKYEQQNARPTKNLPKPKAYIEKQQSSAHSDENCIICSETMKNRQAVWNCRQCFKYIHLKCMKTWIINCNKQFKKSNILNWSCPQCKYQYSEQMPEYYCFCGKYKNPQYDRELPPHSCGNFCERKRGPNCPHLCPLRCHKGKCPPCNFEGIQINCCCGKQNMKIKCSDELTQFVCQNKCEKTLSCKKHKCAKACHIGPCNPCAFKHMSSCYCGKNDDVISCQLQSYSCQSKCEKMLDCGNHKCQQLCHSGNCQPCKRKPQVAKKCPCGQFDLMMLLNEPRKICTDPIPLCGMPCKKKLACGHNCTKSCHEGPCSACKIQVTQICSCTSSSRKAQCWMLLDQNQRFQCQKVCRKRKGCGIHQCQTVCCPYKFSNNPADHQCTIVCQKQFSCKKHNCDMPCHAGNCGHCRVLISQPVPCPCGKTFLRPPVSCGALAPECDNLCLKQMQCGHFCKLTCHYGPCQCNQKVQVLCQCQKNKIETDCGRSALCTQRCKQALPCGHICQLQCHKQPCPSEECQKICRKIRSCGHVCLQRCHPSTQCINYPCQTQILIKCECGHRQKMVPCGSTGILLQKHITCNKTCESIKRFKILYSGKDVYYPSNLVYFGLKNYTYLEKLQDNIEKYIRSEKEQPLHVEFKFGYDQAIKMSMQILFEKHYHLDSYFSPHKKSPFFTILKTKNTMIPSPNLSHYITLVGKGQIKKNNVPFQASLKFAPMTKDKSDTLQGYLQEYEHKYYLERKQKALFLHFWLSQHAQNAFDFVIQKYPNYPCTLDLHNENIPQEQQVHISEVIAAEASEKIEKQQEVVQTKIQEEKKETEALKKTEQQIQKEKIHAQQIKKLFIKPTVLKKVFPPSSDLVQTIYQLDNEELNQQKVDWQKYGDQLAEKQLGIQASEWRIRTFVIIKGVYNISKPQWLILSFKKLFALYTEQKTKAKRLLSHRSFDVKSAEQFLDQNDIILSKHEPQMVAYYILNKHLNEEQIEEFPQQLQKTHQVEMAINTVENLIEEEFKSFFETFKESQFTICCILEPFRIQSIKTSIANLIIKGKKFQLKKVYQSLMFESQGQFEKYISSLGYHLEIKPSKKENSTLIYHILVKNETDVEEHKYEFKQGEWLLQKRDAKYANEQPSELYKDKYCLLSHFAFGDHKFETNTYINRLIKSLKR